MQWNTPALYRAVQARDARFDGCFFTAVRTTGIFCRPVCPAPTPKPGNIEFFPTAAAAALAGYRPCLRCRPETAPSSPIWNGTASTVNRALRMLEAGEAGNLADRLGISDRHLRRLFHQHVGAPPREVEITGRVLLAKSLISDTALPLTEIAFAAGFLSVRRFNDAMRKVYHCSPTAIRRREAGAAEASAIRLKLSYLPPYDWPRFRAFIGPRAIPGLEAVDGDTYTRTLRLGSDRVAIQARHLPTERVFLIAVDLKNVARLREVVERARTFFDLRCSPERIRRHLRRSLRIAAGLRVPGSWDRFETAVRAVIGQQVSVKAATSIAARLCERCGGFPAPGELADVSLGGIGLTPRRAETLRSMAAAIAEGRFTLDSPDAIARLTALRGIGPWTADYIALRCGEPDVFPAGDLVLKRCAKQAHKWRPWRSYAAMAIWTREVKG